MEPSTVYGMIPLYVYQVPKFKAKDIAAELGLSTSAVSLALNGKPGVSAKTREQVLQIAEQRGYNQSKDTNDKPTNTICFVIYIDQNVGIVEQTTFSSFVLQGIESTATALGYKTLIRYYYAIQSFDEQMSDIIEDVAGFIILGTDMTIDCKKEIDLFIGKSSNVPIVIIDNFLFATYVDCVGNDNMLGAKSAISYLIGQGHKKIGYLRSKQRIANFSDREMGVRIAMSEHMMLELDPLEIVDVDIAFEKAFINMSDWLKTADNIPDAFFAENDVIAAAAIRAFKLCGLRVPEDVSIIGFDDIPICEMMDPSITTVRAFKELLGEISVRLLHLRLQTGYTVESARKTGLLKVAVSTQIQERNSVKKRE